MLPTFLILGAQKAGTTFLHELLVEHPRVGSPVKKEIHYFTLHFARPTSWYRAQFPLVGSADHVGEAAPYYLFHPACPERVRTVVPQAKLLVLLRDPVARAYSHHSHEVALGYEKLDFATALSREEGRLAGEEERLLADPHYQSFAHRHYSYVSRGLYARQLERWYQQFPREQLLIIASEQLFASPVETLHRVQAWLGLQPHTPNALAARNSRSYSPMAPDVRAMLKARFATETAALAELAGGVLPWA